MSVIRKKLLSLLVCSFLGLGVIFILFNLAKSKNHMDNHFTRLFPPHFLSNGQSLDLQVNSFYLAGMNKTSIFIGNLTGPALLTRTGYELKDTTHLVLKVDPEIRIAAGAAKLYVDSPDIYLIDGVTPLILKGDYSKLEMRKTSYHNNSFDEFAITSTKSFTTRVYYDQIKEMSLNKCTFSPSSSTPVPGLLKKQGDGVFSPDGQLIQDLQSKKMLYVYFYRNEFIYLDTNMNLILKGNTIDTIRTPQIRLSRIFSENKITFSSPPLTVNKTCCTNAGLLYVNSSLKATNESEDSYSESSVIDIYTLNNGHYLYSFYIPDDNHIKIRNFQVFNHKLVAFYEHSVMTFNIQY